MRGTGLKEKTRQPLGDSLSISEINQLKTDYNELIQEMSELKAGVLMLAQLVNVDIPEDYTSEDLVSDVAGWIEDLQKENQELKDFISVLTNSDFLSVMSADELKSEKVKQIQEVLKEAQAKIKSIIEQPEG